MTTPKISKEVEDLLTPDRMHDKADDSVVPSPPRKPDPAKTQKELERLLCPDDLRDKPDDPDLKPDPTGLVPDWAREKKDEGDDDELQSKKKTPDEKESDNQKGLTLGEWIEKQAKLKEDAAEKESKAAEKEKLAIERENEEIRKSFRRVTAKMKGDDLTPDELK